MVPYVDIIGLCHSVAILLDIFVMHVYVKLRGINSFQAHADYGTWSIDFDKTISKVKISNPFLTL